MGKGARNRTIRKIAFEQAVAHGKPGMARELARWMRRNRKRRLRQISMPPARPRRLTRILPMSTDGSRRSAFKGKIDWKREGRIG